MIVIEIEGKLGRTMAPAGLLRCRATQSVARDVGARDDAAAWKRNKSATEAGEEGLRGIWNCQGGLQSRGLRG